MTMRDSLTGEPSLADHLLDGIEDLLEEVLVEGQPLELDPWRSRLFELFVTAHGAGLTEEDATPDLSADALCRELGSRWGLADAARESVALQQKLSPAELTRMRLLWSMMRMWMEWTYAWQRWPEFHG